MASSFFLILDSNLDQVRIRKNLIGEFFDKRGYFGSQHDHKLNCVEITQIFERLSHKIFSTNTDSIYLQKQLLSIWVI